MNDKKAVPDGADRMLEEDKHKGGKESVNRATDERETAGSRRNIPRVAEVTDETPNEDD